MTKRATTLKSQLFQKDDPKVTTVFSFLELIWHPKLTKDWKVAIQKTSENSRLQTQYFLAQVGGSGAKNIGFWDIFWWFGIPTRIFFQCFFGFRFWVDFKKILVKNVKKAIN